MGENGFDLLNRIDIAFRVIFVTAYDEYAVRAFEGNALDYLLKPLKKERIAKAMERVFQTPSVDEQKRHYTMDDTIFLLTGTRACFIKLKDICFIQADSSYSKIYISDASCKTSTQTLKRWGELLPEDDFFRVHRSFFLNIHHIAEIKKRTNGTYAVVLNHMHTPVEISRRCASDLKNRLNL
jgi:two-component system, LytTR family, response regulator